MVDFILMKNYFCEHKRHMAIRPTHTAMKNANCFSANWQVMAGIGPLTISYTQSLIPLFELNDGTGIYPNSLCLGLDLWYLMRR